ncbi:MAG: hypothetical protein Kow00122_07650 [Thermoleophilia bacterium]
MIARRTRRSIGRTGLSSLSEPVWRLFTWWPLPALFAGVMLVSAALSLLVPQAGLGTGGSGADLRRLLPGIVTPADALHSLVFLVAALGLGVSVALTAVDRLLADRPVDLSWFCEGVVWSGVLALLVFSLLHLFLFRQLTVPIGPGETIQAPSLDLTLRGAVTGWRPGDGSLATLEVAPRLAGGGLTGPFGEQDRPKDAPLAVDAVKVTLEKGRAAEAAGLRLRLREPPSAWAVRVRVSWQGRSQTSPFLQGGQGWVAGALFADPAVEVTVDRVIPTFRPDVSILTQPQRGPALSPAAVVTLRQANEVVGSRALAPGDAVVMGDFPVLLEGFAPVVDVVLWKGSFVWGILAALGVTIGGGLGWTAVRVLARRRRGPAEAG